MCLETVRRLGHRCLDLLRGRLYVLLQLAQFVEIDFALDVALDLGHVALQAAKQMPEGARCLRELFRTEHYQRHDGDNDDFAETDVEHARAEPYRPGL